MSDVSRPPIRAALKPRHSGASHPRTIMALVLREMASRYGRTPGGYIWAVIEPLGMIIFLSYGFSLLLRSPPLGGSFIVFYATGQLVYTLFLRTNTTTMTALRYSRSLLSYPAVSWIDAVLARLILNVLTELLVAYILLGSIILIFDHRSTLDFAAILTAFSLAILLGFGMGLINCVLISFFPVWRQTWKIITRPLFLASGVIWIYEELPRLAQDILWWNPLVHITGLSREGFFSTYDPQHVSVLFVMTPALIMIAMGLLLIRRFNQRIVNSY